MYKLFENEDIEKIEVWMNECEKSGFKLANVTNIATRGIHDIIVIMHKKEE